MLISARKHDIYSLMRKFLGKSSDNCFVSHVEWTNHDLGWCVEFSEAFDFDIYQLKDIFANVLVVSPRAIVIGVRRG